MNFFLCSSINTILSFVSYPIRKYTISESWSLGLLGHFAKDSLGDPLIHLENVDNYSYRSYLMEFWEHCMKGYKTPLSSIKMQTINIH